jgi:ABC-2 type transport system ATP-binding protein
MGIWEVVETFTRNGGTVLLTTHYMEEAARLCQRVGIIDHGKLIASDTPTELIRMLGADEVIELGPMGPGDGFPEGAVKNLPGVHRVEKRGDQWALLVQDVAAALPSVLQTLNRAGMEIRTLSTHKATLDDVFVHLTGRELAREQRQQPEQTGALP